MILLFGSCKSVKTLLNQNTVSSEDQRRLSIQANNTNLSNITEVDFAVNLGAPDFDTILMPAFDKMLNDQQISHVKSYKIKNLSSNTDRQQIEIAANFKATLDTLNVSIDGRLIGTVSFSVKNDSLVLYPAFKYIHVNDVTYKKFSKLKRKAIAGIINIIFDNFMTTLNGQLNEKVPVIPLNLLDQEIASGSIVNDNNVTVTLSKPLVIDTPISSSACLIDVNGIHILGSFTTPVGQPGTTITDFNSFRACFRQKRDSAFPETPDDKMTYLVLAKKSFANLFNEAFAGAVIDVKYANDNMLSSKADKNITLDLDEIKCSKVHFDCPQLRVVPNCNSPFNCGGSCGWDPVCATRKKLCQAAQAAWYATMYGPCQATRLAELAANEAIKLQCRAAELYAISQCEIVKKSLQVVLGNKVNLGDVHTSASASGTASGTISAVTLAPDLTDISLDIAARADIPLKASFGFTPHDAVGHLVCALSFDHPYETSVSASKPLSTDRVAISIANGLDNRLMLSFKTSPVDFDIKINPSPLQLMSRDIPMLINCPLLKFGAGLGNIVKSFEDIFLDGDFGDPALNAIFFGDVKYKMSEKEFSLPVASKDVKLLDNSISLQPIVKQTYLGFVNGAVTKKVAETTSDVAEVK